MKGHLARFSDDLVPAGNTPPQTYGGLLVDLKVFGKPDHIKRRRVRRWLKHNEPSSNLACFLYAEGYDVELPAREDGTEWPQPNWFDTTRQHCLELLAEQRPNGRALHT